MWFFFHFVFLSSHIFSLLFDLLCTLQSHSVKGVLLNTFVSSALPWNKHRLRRKHRADTEWFILVKWGEKSSWHKRLNLISSQTCIKIAPSQILCSIKSWHWLIYSFTTRISQQKLHKLLIVHELPVIQQQQQQKQQNISQEAEKKSRALIFNSSLEPF